MKPQPGTYLICSKAVVDTLPGLSGSAVKAYLVLTSMADHDSGKCWPSHQTIGMACGISERSVRNALAELVDAGLVRMTNRGRVSSLYEVLYPEAGCRLNGSQTGSRLPDKDALTGKNLHFNRKLVADKQTSRTNKKESSCDSEKKPTRKGTKKTKVSDSAKPREYPKGFADWWKAYPRPVKKPEAAKAFTNAIARLLADDDRPMITTEVEATAFLQDRAEAYARQIEADGTEDKFVAHPASWLNGDRFDDEFKAPPPKPNAVATKADLEAEGWNTEFFDN